MPRENEVITIIGRKGSGKSTRAREIVRTHPRRIIIDPMREYTDGVIVRTFGALADYLRPRRFSQYSVVLRTMEDSDVMATIALPTVGDPETGAPLPGLMLLIDEADKWCNPRSVPDEFKRLINYGRHFEVSTIMVARRAASLPRDLTANSDKIIVFPTQEPADVDYLSEYIGSILAERAKANTTVGHAIVWPDDLNGEPENDRNEDDPPPNPSLPGSGDA